MKRIIFILILLFSIYGTINAGTPLIQKARIRCTSAQLPELARLGIPADEGIFSKEGYFTSDFYEDELVKIRQNGFEAEILIADLGKYYAERNETAMKLVKSKEYQQKIAQSTTDWPVPAGFNLGSMGGFNTWAEVQLALDNMHTLYPNLITAKAPATTSNTIEGRPIYYMKISDNPTVNENEPQVLYTGLHHAREPISMQLMIFYMYYLLENYTTDPLVHYLVDNTEMYFIPVLNPDGYCYNELTNPAGGGNWRKNRKDIGGGAYGVDLNRNYDYMWGIDDIGSSTDPFSETYRGTEGFSEIETQNIRDFVIAHNFKLVMNYHSFRNGTLFPWGFTDTQLAPDDSTFRMYSRELTRENHYLTGNVSAVLNYLANGGSDDWLYGEQVVKPKIFGFTPEVGDNNAGFWPSPEMIIPLCRDNMWQNLAAALLVNKYAIAHDENPVFIAPQGYLKYNIRRLGMEPSAFTVSIQAIGNSFQSIGPAVTYSSLAHLEQRYDSIPYTLNANVQAGQEVKFVLTVSYSGLFFQDTLTKYAGIPVIVYNNPCNSTTGWTGSWATTSSSYYSPSYCITDSPSGLYNNDEYSFITLNTPINLSGAAVAFLDFRAKWQLEGGYDYVQISASDNNGITWEPLKGLYTHPGGSNEPVGEPLYDWQQSEWVHEMINLQDYTGSQIKLRFTLVTDGGVTYDGFYFDDIDVQIINPVGIDEVSGNDPIMFEPVPNPARQSISFNFNKQAVENTRILIYDQLGQIISENKPDGSSIVINTADWKPGIYYYSLVMGKVNLKKGKFIIIP